MERWIGSIAFGLEYGTEKKLGHGMQGVLDGDETYRRLLIII